MVYDWLVKGCVALFVLYLIVDFTDRYDLPAKCRRVWRKVMGE